jgi:hypothetical protein
MTDVFFFAKKQLRNIINDTRFLCREQGVHRELPETLLIIWLLYDLQGHVAWLQKSFHFLDGTKLC